MRYLKLKALISAIIGKTVMLIVCAYGGYDAIELIHKYLIRSWDEVAESLHKHPVTSDT
jgi:muramoyltetrapeptide carboxypeptidase LdcA involved in peptidoglycan recycling